MLKIMYIALYAFILVSSTIYVWHYMLNKKIDFKNPKIYITLVVLMIISISNYFMVNKFIKIILITIVFMVLFRFLFKERIQKCIIIPIYYQLIIIFCETIFALIILIVFNGNESVLLNSYLGTLLINSFVAITSVIISKFKIIHIIYNKLLQITDKIKPIQLYAFCMLAMLTTNILIMGVYYNIEFKYLFILNIIIIFGCFVIVFYMFKTQNNYNKVSDKYNVAIKSLNDYETMMTKYRIANHENKNLLLTVRAMILNKEKEIPRYIDSMVEEKYADDEKLMLNMSVIPSGGLRATIYSEILKIKENKIEYNLNIDRNIKSIDLIELDTNTVIGICKIIGVFIDNAIEAVYKLKKRNITINLYMEENRLYIKISNNYKGNIDINKISNSGYTTKGPGHGYGLSLVKTIIEKNNLFENNTEIKKEVFSQILSIKI